MKLKLRARYALVFAGITVAVVAAVKTIDLLESLRYQHDIKVSSSEAMSASMLREAESVGLSLAAMMASSLLEPVFEEDFDEISNIARAAGELPRVERALVYDRDALVIHDGTEEILAYGTAAPEVMREAVIGRGEVLVDRRADAIEISYPIRIGQRVLGGIALTVRLDQALADIGQLREELDAITQAATGRQMHQALIVAVAMSLLGVIIGALIALRLSRPIRQLTAIAAQIALGQYRFELPFRRSDELGELGSGLQAMARELEDSTVSRTQLEAEIAERTTQLRAANRQLEALDKNRRQFFAEVSHELKTPLTVILGEAEVMLRKRDASTAEFRDCLRRIAGQTEQVGRLVSDLLDLAQAEADNFRFEETDVGLTSVVLDSCADANVLARSGEVKIRPQIEPGTLLVRGDRQRLRQLCLVLLDNAIRHSDLGTEVVVSCREQGGTAILEVSDDGVGMSQNALDSAFDGFDRSATRVRESGGKGLGLPIAKTIVEAHGGTIHIDSKLGLGTTITVRLPLRAARLLRSEHLASVDQPG